MEYFITGDTHGANGVIERINELQTKKNFQKDDAALIILGDAGLNFFLDERDEVGKSNVNEYKIPIYIVRGNHEALPANIYGIQVQYDYDIKGAVFTESKYPCIHYLLDGGEYSFNGLETLVIGGAYSIDKFLRLNGLPEDTDEWTGWFKDEQLPDSWWTDFFNYLSRHHKTSFDLILTHTCPIDWMPRDLFINAVGEIDKTTEKHLFQLKEKIDYKYWCFGHFHDDRVVRPRVNLFSKMIMSLTELQNFWDGYENNISPLFWAFVRKDPNFYMN